MGHDARIVQSIALTEGLPSRYVGTFDRLASLRVPADQLADRQRSGPAYAWRDGALVLVPDEVP